MTKKAFRNQKIDSDIIQIQRDSNLKQTSHSYEFVFWSDSLTDKDFKHFKYKLKQYLNQNKKLLNNLIFDYKVPERNPHMEYNAIHQCYYSEIVVFSKDKLDMDDELNKKICEIAEDYWSDYKVFKKKPEKNN